MATPYYEQDGITIWHGDCREILPTLSGVNLVVTSPPYNQMSVVTGKASGMWGRTAGGVGFVREWAANGYADNKDEAAYQIEQNEVGRLLSAACADDASLFYNHQLRWRDGVCLHPVQWFHPEGWRMRQEIIWDRGGGMMFNARMFVRFDERILWFTRGDSWKWNQTSVGFSTVWRLARMQQQNGKVHPVEYPVEIPTRAIMATTDAGDIVLDPYCGGGTTLVAAKLEGRRAIGIEMEERYCEIAAKRLAQGVLAFD